MTREISLNDLQTMTEAHAALTPLFELGDGYVPHFSIAVASSQGYLIGYLWSEGDKGVMVDFTEYGKLLPEGA